MARFVDGMDSCGLVAIEPMKRFARLLRGHRPLILKLLSSQRAALQRRGLEDFNAKRKLAAYGFRTYHGLEVALYHALVSLPKPKLTHKVS